MKNALPARSTLYKAARILGDLKAARDGRAGARLWNRALGRLLGRLFGKLRK